jgi:hypothetical protein
MIRIAAIALAVLVGVDYLFFGGSYSHTALQIASSVLNSFR